MSRMECGESPRSGQDAISEWDAELDRLFVGLRRSVGVATGAGTETLLATEEGKALASAGVLTESEGRLVVARPLLTDVVHRSVLTLTAPNVESDGNA